MRASPRDFSTSGRSTPADGAPYVLEDRWIDPAVVPAAADESFAEVGPNEWLVREVPFEGGDFTFSATPATAAEAAALCCCGGRGSLSSSAGPPGTGGRVITSVRLVFIPATGCRAASDPRATAGPQMQDPEPYGIHTRSIHLPDRAAPLHPQHRSAPRTPRNSVPSQIPRPQRKSPRYPPEIPLPYQQVVPQEISMLQCYFLEQLGATSNTSFAKGTQGTESGSQTARSPERCGNGTSEPGCTDRKPDRKGNSGCRDIVKFPEGKAGANWTDGLRPAASGRRQGRVARHNAKTASEHLTPVPANGNGARLSARAPSMMRTASMHLCPLSYTRARCHATISGVPPPTDPHIKTRLAP